MDMENTPFNKQHMKATGLMAKNREKVKLFLKVEVFLKVHLKMISKMDTEKCIIILQVTILKANGGMIKSKDKGQWIGLTLDKNMLVSGRITIKRDGECTFGYNLKVKENI